MDGFWFAYRVMVVSLICLSNIRWIWYKYILTISVPIQCTYDGPRTSRFEIESSIFRREKVKRKEKCYMRKTHVKDYVNIISLLAFIYLWLLTFWYFKHSPFNLYPIFITFSFPFPFYFIHLTWIVFYIYVALLFPFIVLLVRPVSPPLLSK